MKNGTASQISHEANLDSPLRLEAAAKAAFPDGSMSASGLRREAARGRLVIERIAGKDFTTLTNIKKMRELCRLDQKAHVSGYGQRSGKMEGSSVEPVGLSSTEAAISPQDALRTKLKKPSTSSPSTSQTNTGPRAKSGISS